MVRPRRMRFVRSRPGVIYYKPRGVPLSSLEEVILNLEEFEAVRLTDHKFLEQDDASRKMNVSRQTFGRVLQSARRKIGEALAQGKAIRLEGGVNNLVKQRFGRRRVRRQNRQRRRFGWGR